MRIDAHQHFWKFDANDFPWNDDATKVLKNDFLPKDLKKLMVANSVEGCISVQTKEDLEETQFLLEQSDKHKFIKGVVGWVDLMSPELDNQLKRFTKHSKFCGVRHIVQDEPAGFMLQPEFILGLKTLFKYNLTYDILIQPHQLYDAIKVCETFPDQKFMIDHMARPRIRQQEMENWSVQIKKLAANPNVYCKFSGLITEANWTKWQPEDIKPYLDVALEAFGEDRLVFGSDWPLCLLAGEYSDVVNLADEFLNSLKKGAREKIMGKNALRFYNL